MKKLSNILDESAWGDMMRRGSGEIIRKEDATTNINDIKPIDMGLSVLWADKDLESKKDDSCYFAYDDIENLIKNSGWRLPTKEETLELFNNTHIVKNTDELCIIEGKNNNNQQIVFYKKGYQLGDSDTIYSNSSYYCWTSTIYKLNKQAYYVMSIRQYQVHILLEKRNKVLVRLVKDKEKRED